MVKIVIILEADIEPVHDRQTNKIDFGMTGISLLHSPQSRYTVLLMQSVLTNQVGEPDSYT